LKKYGFFSKADLCLCLGTSLQIRPCRDLPRKTKKNGGKIVIVNLQKTSLDSLADLIIHERCDRVMKYILEKLNINFDEKSSPTSLINISKYSHVKKIILLSGKSKSGKDFIGNKLAENLPALLLNLHESLKIEYLKTHGNDNSSDTLQENMIKWGEEKSREDPTIFCRMMLEQNDQLCLSYPIWIIDDVKSSTEIEFFKKMFDNHVLLVRIEASNETRQKRGWNVPDPQSECQLDTNIQWSFVFSNNDEDNLNEQMNNLMQRINSS
jgi:phosphomevalonate kinase